MKRLVIVTTAQFGHHIDTYCYCKLLRHKYDVVYVGWDHGLDKVRLEGIKIINVDRKNRIRRVFRYLKEVIKEARHSSSILFIKYAPLFPFLFKLLLPKTRTIIDIRSASVSSSKAERWLKDLLLRMEMNLAPEITIVSEGLKNRLKIKDAYVLPVGATPFTNQNYEGSELRFLYVGTLFNRNIDQLLLGFANFVKSEKRASDKALLTIIGDGPGQERVDLIHLAHSLKISDKVRVLGRVCHENLGQYFEYHNIGISYVPLTDYFDHQPPTKTFEYLASGLLVLATTTSENSKIIHGKNGVLIGDTPEEVARGMALIFRNFDEFNSKSIRTEVDDFSWERIVGAFDASVLSRPGDRS